MSVSAFGAVACTGTVCFFNLFSTPTFTATPNAGWHGDLIAAGETSDLLPEGRLHIWWQRLEFRGEPLLRCPVGRVCQLRERVLRGEAHAPTRVTSRAAPLGFPLSSCVD